MPEWNNYNIEIYTLKGGVTSRIYRVKCKDGDVAIRVYSDKAEIFLDRNSEASAIKQMADIGVSSKLIKYIPEKHAIITEFIPNSSTLTNSDFLKDNLIKIINDPVKRIHSYKGKVNNIFNPYKQCLKLYNILKKLNSFLPELDKINKAITKLKLLIDKINISENKYVITHNDLTADNFILVNEKHKDKFKKPIYIIDWEYTGMGPKYYDIADMFQEILVPREIELKFIEDYCEGKNFEETVYYCDMFKPFPDIYWFIWSLIQETTSKIEFDFYNYGYRKYNNAVKNFELLKKEYNRPV